MPFLSFQSRLQRGNALFLILIAVALFAALSYAVTQSGRGGGTVDKENKELALAQMMAYMGQMEQAVSRMMLINGCLDSQFNFDHSSWNDGDAYNNDSGSPAPPADGSCDVYSPVGGGMDWQRPPAVLQVGSANEYLITNLQIPGLGVSGGSAGKELVIISHVPEDICRRVNVINGIANPATTPPLNGTTTMSIPAVSGILPFDGNYFSIPAYDVGATFTGKSTGCFCYDLSTGNCLKSHLYHVLLAR